MELTGQINIICIGLKRPTKNAIKKYRDLPWHRKILKDDPANYSPWRFPFCPGFYPDEEYLPIKKTYENFMEWQIGKFSIK